MSWLRLLPETWKEALRRRAGALTTRSRIENLRRAGLVAQQIIDAGAYRGDWTRMAHAVFPDASILLIEPQPDRAADLRQLCRELPSCRFRAEALGARAGTAHLVLAESNSRLAPPLPGEETCPIQVSTLAEIATAEAFLRCDLLKLDLQGRELDALAGAGELFGRIEAIIVETSLLEIGPVPVFHEMHDAFRARNYRLYDLFGMNHRPLDGALWQVDCVFVREDSGLLARRQFG